MAMCVRFVCGECDHAIEAWDDGNPYYIDVETGEKKYAYHPEHDLLALCIGNDAPHLCLSCGKEFVVDSREPKSTCPKCKSEDISDRVDLDGRGCPSCKKGTFSIDPDWHLIS
jgi:Zn finger protein HypA/HybF involved in hydrogenase expression